MSNITINEDRVFVGALLLSTIRFLFTLYELYSNAPTFADCHTAIPREYVSYIVLCCVGQIIVICMLIYLRANGSAAITEYRREAARIGSAANMALSRRTYIVAIFIAAGFVVALFTLGDMATRRAHSLAMLCTAVTNGVLVK